MSETWGPGQEAKEGFMADNPDVKKWEELAAKQLRGRPLEDLDWQTPSGPSRQARIRSVESGST